MISVEFSRSAKRRLRVKRDKCDICGFQALCTHVRKRFPVGRSFIVVVCAMCLVDEELNGAVAQAVVEERNLKIVCSPKAEDL